MPSVVVLARRTENEMVERRSTDPSPYTHPLKMEDADSSTNATRVIGVERRKKKPYKELTLEEKVRLIRMAEENAGMSQASIAERYAIAKSNVCRILQRKQEYLRAYESAGFAGSRKRKLRGDSESVSTAFSSTLKFQSRRGFQPVRPTVSKIIQSYNDEDSPLINDNRIECVQKGHLGNETLRAHMYKQHQISRMFMCRCCNWAFPDKTSLHMHMQAKEEGKNISVPVIGKGNPPSQVGTGDASPHMNGSNQQVPTLHTPQARAPVQSASRLTQLQLHSLNALSSHPALSTADPAAIHAAAASLFPQMALLRPSGSGTQTDNLMSKLQERLMLNNFLAQSGFGLAAWLTNLPRMDSGIGRVLTPNSGGASTKSDVEMTNETDDDVNVDKDTDDISETAKDLSSNDNTKSSPDDSGYRSALESAAIYDSMDCEKKENFDRSGDKRKSVAKDEENSAINSSQTKMNGHSVVSTSEENPTDKTTKCDDTAMDITIGESVSCDINALLAETQRSSSPNGCDNCSVYKRKLLEISHRCRILEEKTASLQVNPLQYGGCLSLPENSFLEHESRVLKEQNEILQRKLFECQEKTLTFMQGNQTMNTQAVSLYLSDILKITFLH